MWRIVDWDEHFENNRSREVKDCKWVAMPNSHDGDGYTELVDHPNGAAHFGAWCAIVQVASKSLPRGELRRRDGRQFHDAKSLSRITRIEVSVFDEVIPRLIEMKWIEIIPEAVGSQQLNYPSQDAAEKVGSAPQLPALNGMEWKEGKGRERKEGNGTPAARVPAVPCEPTLKDQIDQVYSRYLHHHTRAAKSLNPSSKEFKLIRARLSEGFAVIDLQAAIDGNHISPFHCGENKDGSEYHGLSVIFRDSSQVTNFIEFASGKKQVKDPRGNIAAANEYLSMFEGETPE